MKNLIHILILAFAFSCPVALTAMPAQQISQNVTDAPKVTVSQGVLTISAAADGEQMFEIYSITGQLVKRVKITSGTASVELHRGCYIVRCQGWSKKVVIN